MPVPVIAITNESTLLTDQQVKDVIPALQQQVSHDFAGYWNADATLIFVAKGTTLVEGWWQIVVLDDPDQADALGYHELTATGDPLGKIFVRADQDAGSSWTVTISHELLEMIGDPDIDAAKQGADGNFYALEVCDAVEDDACGYQINGVLVSDFVTPRWFNDSIECDRYSFQKHVSASLQLAPGGYIGVFKDGNWTQITAQKVTAALNIKPGSRRARRMQRAGGSTFRKSGR